MSATPADAVVLLDLDDTLVDRQGAFAAWLTEFTSRWQLDALAQRHLLALDAKGETPRSVLLAAARDAFGVTASLDSLLADYAVDLPRHVRALPGVQAGLQELRRGGRSIGVITNGAGLPQRRKLAHAGLESLVDAVVISEEVGLRKPDPAIFSLARRALGVAEDQDGWMVGDLLHTDIAGGRAAGLRTVWVTGDEPASTAALAGSVPPVPDYVCRTTDEALAMIARS